MKRVRQVIDITTQTQSPIARQEIGISIYREALKIKYSCREYSTKKKEKKNKQTKPSLTLRTKLQLNDLMKIKIIHYAMKNKTLFTRNKKKNIQY